MNYYDWAFGFLFVYYFYSVLKYTIFKNSIIIKFSYNLISAFTLKRFITNSVDFRITLFKTEKNTTLRKIMKSYL